MLSVLHIRSSFDVGGTESLLLHLFNQHQNLFKIHLVLIKNGSLINELNNSENRYYLWFRKRFLDFSVLLKIYKLLKQENIKIIHTHQEIELIYATLLKLMRPKIRIFHSIHLINYEFNKGYIIEKLLTPFIYKFIAVSKHVKNHLIKRKYPEKKIEIVYNGVENNLHENEFELNHFKKSIYYHEEDFIIMMIGNFRREKDQLTLVKAFNLLRNTYPKLKLIFIGRLNEYAENCIKNTMLEDLNKRVFYMNALENAVQFISLCDLFVYSSRSETFGIAVIEALYRKKPVLASDIPVMVELSNDGKYFELFKVGDENDLAFKIENFIKNKNFYKDKIEKAYQYALSKFSYEAFIKKLNDIYNS